MSWLNLPMMEGFCQGVLTLKKATVRLLIWLLPRSFIWKDGHVYEIQKVTDVRRAASLRAGGAGIRYTCIVDGKESHLFYEDNNMWFMEER